jgi:hypothetical protein
MKKANDQRPNLIGMIPFAPRLQGKQPSLPLLVFFSNG